MVGLTLLTNIPGDARRTKEIWLCQSPMYPRGIWKIDGNFWQRGPREESHSPFRPFRTPVLAPALRHLRVLCLRNYRLFRGRESGKEKEEVEKVGRFGVAGGIWWPTSSFWKMPLERDYPPSFFSSSSSTPFAKPTPGGGERIRNEWATRVPRAHSLFFVLPSFLSSLPRFIPHGIVAPHRRFCSSLLASEGMSNSRARFSPESWFTLVTA